MHRGGHSQACSREAYDHKEFSFRRSEAEKANRVGNIPHPDPESSCQPRLENCGNRSEKGQSATAQQGYQRTNVHNKLGTKCPKIGAFKRHNVRRIRFRGNLG